MSSLVDRPAVVEEAAGSGLLALREIWKRYPSAEVLTGADLELLPGSLAALTGRNGAGKTTLLRVAAGLIVPDAGEVRIGGLDPERHRREFQRRLGYLPAGNGGLYARLSVFHNLELWCGLALLPRRERADAIHDSLVRFDLAELASHRVDRLSMGQRQRVRLAMVFLHRPDVVLLDEPATSLDGEALALLGAALAELVARGGAALWGDPAPPATMEVDVVYRVEGGTVVVS